MATTQLIEAVEDRITESVRQGQEAIVSAVRTWAEATKQINPELTTLPFSVDALPKPAEVLDNAFAFANRLLDAQRDFAKQLLDVLEPVLTPKNGTSTGSSSLAAAKAKTA